MLLVASFFCLPYYTETISNDRGYQGDLWIDPLTRLKLMRMSSLEPIVMLVLGKQTLFFIRLSNGLIIANCEMQTHHHHHYHHNLKQVKN